MDGGTQTWWSSTSRKFSTACPTSICFGNYSTARAFFLISHPSQWGRLFYPLQSHSRLQSNITCNFMACTLWSPCNPTVFPLKWVESQWAIKLTFPFSSSKTKYIGVIHPTAIPLKAPQKPSVFSLQCFHRNGWNHSGVRNFNPFHSVLLSPGMDGKLKTPSSFTVHHYGIYQWISSFLFGHSQCVVVEGCSSDSVPVISGFHKVWYWNPALPVVHKQPTRQDQLKDLTLGTLLYCV